MVLSIESNAIVPTTVDQGGGGGGGICEVSISTN